MRKKKRGGGSNKENIWKEDMLEEHKGGKANETKGELKVGEG